MKKKKRGNNNYVNSNFQCDVCKKFFTAKRSLDFHLKKCFFGMHSSESSHKCDLCGATYTYRKSMLRHKRKVHENIELSSSVMFQCEICKKGFSRKGDLRKHFNKCCIFSKIRSPRLYKCDVCGAEYNYKNSMVRHKRNMHGENGIGLKDSFQCDTCEKVYTTRDYFIFHLKKCFFAKDNVTPVYKCDICETVFSYKTSMLRHKRKIHENKGSSSSTEMFQCDICKRIFTKKDSLKFHLRKCFFAENSCGRLFKCDECGAEYHYKKSMLRHKHAIHEKVILNPEENLLTNLKYQCSTCGRAFARKDVLKIHIEKCFFGNTFIGRWFQCDSCGQQFAAKKSLIRHCVRHQNGTQLNCKECSDSFPKIRIFHTLMAKYDAEVIHEHLDFATKDAVFKWKVNLEKSTATRYRKGGVSKGKRDTVYRFICHRSGSYTPKMNDRKREMKFYGSKKVGTCPAQIIVRMKNDTGSCKVLYVKTHLGHNICNKREELPHIYPKKRNFVYIEPEIMLDVAHNMNVAQNTVEKLCGTLSENTSSGALHSVEDFAFAHANSIIYYKKQNELDEKYPLLSTRDIVIIMMTDSQKERLQKYGGNVVMMDGTHGVDNYNFLVHTLLVIDDYDEWVEVAFAISNRNDKLLSSIFVSCIKEIMGSIKPRAFVTDVQETYYTSWRQVMGETEFRLFCSWQVREDWRRNLKLISNVQKRNHVRNQLYKISSKLDENMFLSELDELLKNEDPDLENFLVYFKKCFVKNIEGWASCYRKGVHIHTSMWSRAFPSALKKAVRKLNILGKIPLNICLQALDVYLKCKNRDFLRKETKGKITSKLSILRKNHKLIENVDTVLNVYGSNSEGWSVALSSDDTNVANVHYICLTREYCQNCKLYCRQCEACIHKYECSCMDSTVRYNMCIHIHALCTFLRDYNMNVDGRPDVPEIITYEELPLESLEEIPMQLVEEDPLGSFEEMSMEEVKERFTGSLDDIIKTLDETPVELQVEVLAVQPKEEPIFSLKLEKSDDLV